MLSCSTLLGFCIFRSYPHAGILLKVEWRKNIEVIYGAMFSGKTEELISRLRNARSTNRGVEAFKPSVDNRYTDSGKIVSHSGLTYHAHTVNNPEVILSHLLPDVYTVGIDEAQFFEDEIVSTVKHIAKQDVRIIIAGLDLDFRGYPFGSMPRLLQLTANTKKLYANCAVCGKQADRTQRLIDGEPAHIDDPLVAVGGEDMYEPRCREHHTVRTS